MWASGTFIFEGRGIVLLSEGTADRTFFTKLMEYHNLPKMDFPWPIEPDEEASAGSRELHGKASFRGMLIALGNFLRLAPELKQKIKCVMIATDSGDNRDKSFQSVKKQIRDAQDFPVPDRVLEVKAGTNGFPAVTVILIPPTGTGGLETLCIKAFSEANETNRNLVECQSSYFECSPEKPHNSWGAEARDKGAFQCLIAASCEDNPSMPTRLAFSRRKKKKPPIIDIAAPAFSEVANALRTIVVAVNAL